jgi:hypothetical protein
MTVIVDIRKRHAKKALLIVYKAHQNYEISNGYAYNAKLYIYIYIYYIYIHACVLLCIVHITDRGWLRRIQLLT